jgi:hypothetical protein
MLQPEGSVIYMAKAPDPGTEKQTRSSPQWNGLRLCICTSRTEANRWYVITDITATSHGENGRRQATYLEYAKSEKRIWVKTKSLSIGAVFILFHFQIQKQRLNMWVAGFIKIFLVTKK